MIPKPPGPPIPPTLKPPVAPTMDVLWGEYERDREGGRGRVSEYDPPGIGWLLILGLGGLVCGGLRPRVWAVDMAPALTLSTNIHCWQAQGCPRDVMAEAGSAPLGYALPFPVPLLLILIPMPTPETSTPSSPPWLGMDMGPQAWWDLGRGPDTSG